MRNRIRNCIPLLLLLLLPLGSCSDERAEIHRILDAREAAINRHDIESYRSLLHPDYRFRNQSVNDVTRRMEKLFGQFEATEINSSERIIVLVDETHAVCEQNYRLRVKADGAWREAVQRERIELTRQDGVWKISSGL